MAYRKFKPEFKRRVVEEWLSGEKGIAQLCRQYELADSLVRRRARRSDPPPGVKVLWRGLTRLDDIVLGFSLAASFSPDGSCG